MKEITVEVKIVTDEDETRKAKENAEQVLARKLVMNSMPFSTEDGSMYEVDGVVKGSALPRGDASE